MSAEKNIYMENTKFVSLNKQGVTKKVMPVRVDINHLLARIRKEQQKDSKTNLLFFTLFASLVVIAGIILSF